MSDWECAVAASLRGKSASDRIRLSLDRAYPVGGAGPFEDLLRAIDVADSERLQGDVEKP